MSYCSTPDRFVNALINLGLTFFIRCSRILLERASAGVDIRYTQELLGHGNIRTTERYTYVSQKAMGPIRSPLDSFNLSEEK